MELSEIRKVAGLTESYKQSRKQQLVEQINAVAKSVEDEVLSEEQLDELFGALGDFAGRMAKRGAQAAGSAVKQGAQAVGNKIQQGAAAVGQKAQQAGAFVKDEYQKSQRIVAYKAALQALAPLAQSDRNAAKIVAFLKQQLAGQRGEPLPAGERPQSGMRPVYQQ